MEQKIKLGGKKMKKTIRLSAPKGCVSND